MRKYLRFFTNELLLKIQYRFSFLSGLSIYVISFISTFFIWKAIFESSGKITIGSYTERQMLIYVSIISFIHYVFNFNTITRLAYLINTGKLNMFLIKPINLMLESFFTYLGKKVLTLSILIIFVSIFKLMGKINNYILIVIFILAIFMLYFYMTSLISCIGFYTKRVGILIGLFNGIYYIISGTYFPLDLLPNTVYMIAKYTPFGLVGYGLTKVIQGLVSEKEIIIYILVCLIYILLFRFAYKVALNKGLKIYEGMGA